MFRWKAFGVLLGFSLVSISIARGQAYPVQVITFGGATGFSEAALLQASGLTVGSSLDQSGMQAGAQRLDATGMFATIKFSFNGRDLHYEMTPATDLLPASFANFPWWDSTTISLRLKGEVPLFQGRVAPDSGTQQKIIDALIAMVGEQHIQAKITATPDVDAVTHKVAGVIFRVASPPVQIGTVTFTGITAPGREKMAEVANAASGQEYSTAESAMTLTQAFESIYRAQGYLEAHVTSVAPQPPVFEAGIVRVPLTIATVEGVQYHLGHFSLAGSVLMDLSEFESKAILKPGEVVAEERLRRSLQMLSSPYVTRGYLRAKISAVPDFHPNERSVNYSIKVIPGEVYHMGKLEVKDLDEERTALVLKNWKLQAGAPYDASYVAQFLKTNAKQLQLLDGYSASYKQFEDEDAHIVNLVVSFRRGGPLS